MALNDNNPPNYQDILDHEGSMYLKGAQRNADQRTGRDLPTTSEEMT